MTATATRPTPRPTRGPGPGWWGAPQQVIRHPALGAALGVAVALLALALAAQPAFSAASANAALGREAAGFDAESLGATLQVQAVLDAAALETATAEVNATGTELGLGRPVLEVGPSTWPLSVTNPASGAELEIQYPIGFPVTAVVVYSRTGVVEHLPDAQGDGDGVWVPRRVAEALGVGTGDALELGGAEPLRVAGTYTDLVDAVPTPAYTGPDALPDDDPIVEYWASRHTLIATVNAQGDPIPSPPLIVVAPEHLGPVAEALTETVTPIRWRFPLEEVPDALVRAEQVARTHQVIEARALDATGMLGSALLDLTGAPAAGQGRIRVQSLLPGVLERPTALVRALEASLAPLALGTQALALLVLAGTAAVLLRRRRTEQALLAVQGTSLAWVTSRGGLQAAAPAIVGAVLGGAAALGLAAAVGPLGGPDTSLLLAVGGAALLAAGLGILVPAAIAGVARPTGAVRSGGLLRGALRRIPWELLLVVAAAVSGVVVVRDGGALLSADATQGVDLLVVAFPLLLVAAVAGLAARAVRTAGPVLRRAGASRGAALHLATARLAAGPGETRAAVGLLALGLGLLTFGTTSAASFAATVEAKGAALAGAPLVVGLTPREVPPSLDAATTEVVRTEGHLLPAGRETEVMGIDPETFPEVAAWIAGFSDRPLEALLDGLGASSADDAVPVIAVGSGAADARALRTERYTVDVRVVGTASAFPGMSERRVLVANRAALIAAAETAGTRLDEDLMLRRRRELWIADGAAELDALGQVHLGTRAIRSLDQVVERPDLQAALGTLTYLRGVGLLVGLLSLLLLIVYALARERARAAALALALRMGLRPSTARAGLALELGLLVVVGGIPGAVAGLVGARVLLVGGDPLPELPPSPLFHLPLETLGWVAVGAVVTVTVAVALASRSAARVNTATLLRDG